jgi:hypothetical protein
MVFILEPATLPDVPARHDLKAAANFCREHPGEWFTLPYPADKSGQIVQALKKNYGLEARSIKTVVYCRAPK